MTTVVDRESSSPQTGVEHRYNDDEAYGILFDAEKYSVDGEPNLGITLREDGCDFAVHVSNDARAVDFCAINPANPGGSIRWRLHPVPNSPDGAKIYTGFMPDIMPGDLYGLRVERDDPGSYHNLLLDPYAKAITRLGQPDHPDSPAYSVIVEEESSTTTRPNIDPKDRVIYEAHIKNSTMLHPDIPEELRGTYLGFCHPAHTAHLKELGITTVQIMPIMQFFSEEFLADAGKVNHWGYNTAGFFAPHEGYAHDKRPGAAIKEVKSMIDTLHAEGFEVVLDVVYNHTAEGGIDAPPHSLRGLDNEGYYRTFTDDAGRQNYWDETGCGNNVDTTKPAAAKLILDSLRYWHEVMGADGFRFDLAGSMIGNGFFAALREDERLKDCLMIAEPWHAYGYDDRGQFARKGIPEQDGWGRDYMRDFWGRGEKSLEKLRGFLEARDMGPAGTVNLITAHDGFTLYDLTAYNTKHNEANGENNRDGADDNRSWNHGCEGPTEDPEVNRQRRRTARNLITMLAMSRGIPMILGGDETLHTQGGNNNPYCQDNEISWRNWNLSDRQKEMGRFVGSLLAIRQRSSLGDPAAKAGEIPGSSLGERGIDWFNLWGLRMEETDAEWHGTPVLGMYSSREASEQATDSLMYYINGSDEDVEVSLPQESSVKGDYEIVADTETGKADPNGIGRVSKTFILKAMSSVVLRRIYKTLPE